jgi:NADH:ubiquinone oxidoreductase subunit 5 (subunit L)/multisubunit Na+/H+ antiporter MnhA subunit
MSALLHPAAPHHPPAFVSAPGETDIFMVVMAVFLVIAVMAIGLLFLRLHTLPERLAHKSHKLQFEIVAVLGLLALFTHVHLFWVAGLLLALIDIPDFGWPLRRIAGSLEKIAGIPPGQGDVGGSDETVAENEPGEDTAEVPETIVPSRMQKERINA